MYWQLRVTFITSVSFMFTAGVLLPAVATAQSEQELEADPLATLEPETPEEEVGEGIEEITISARKREERLQDVPISVTAFTGAFLDETQTFNALDVQFQVPNMIFGKTNFTGANLQIRGIGTSVVAATGEAAVSVHVNTVPVIASRIFETEFFDMERIEVLRGPQGTLFGRNSTGGAYNVYTRKPTDEYDGNLEFMYGNFNNIRLRGALNLPVHERFKMRFAGTYLKRDGFTFNYGTNSDIDNRNLWAARGTLLWEPTDDTTIEVMGSFFREDDERSRIGKQLCNRQEAPSPFSLGCQDGPQGFSTFPGYSTLGGILESYALAGLAGPGTTPQYALYPLASVDPVFGFPQPVDSSIGSINPPNLRQQNARIDPSYRADEGFGMIDLHQNFAQWSADWVTGYQYTKVRSVQDYNMVQAGTPYAASAVAALSTDFPTISSCAGGTGLVLGLFGCADRSGAQDDSRITTHLVSTELRGSTDWEGAFNFTAGAIYIYNWTSTDYFVNFTGAEVLARISLAADPTYDMELRHFNNETDPATTNSFGLFGELYWDITDETKLTLGGRYIYDKKTAESRNYLLTPDPITGGLPLLESQEADWNNGTFRITLDQKFDFGFSDDTLVFGSISRGFKPGGFNPPGATNVGLVPLTFDPEVIYAFELGTKNDFLDNRVRANLTGFFYLYDGYQISSIVNRTAVNENIDANIWGIEFEYTLIPIEHFEIQGSVAYLGSSIKDTIAVDPANPTANNPNFVAMKDLTNGSNFICPLPCNPFAPVDAGQGIPQSLNGNSLPNVSDVQIFILGQYTFELPWQANVIPRISYYWQNEMYGRIFNEVRDEIPSWSEASAGIRYEDVSGRFMIQNWYIDLWVKNFLDNNFVTGQYFTDASSGNFTNVFLLDPRTFGFTIGATF